MTWNVLEWVDLRGLSYTVEITQMLFEYFSAYFNVQKNNALVFMPPHLGTRGIMFSSCPSIRPSVHLSKAQNTLFPHVHGSIGPSDQPWPLLCLSVCLSIYLSVRLSW